METYKQKVRAFLLEPENFDILWELYDFIPTSRKELFSGIVSEFLTELEKGLNDAVADTDWRTKLCIKGCGDYPAVWLFKKEWKGFFDIRLQFGLKDFEAWYGIWREIKEYPNLLDNEEVEGLVDTFAGVEQGFEPREDWWLTWKYIGHFNDVEAIKELLPSTHSALIKEYIDTLVSFAEDVGPRVPELVDKVKPVTPFQEIVDIYNASTEPVFEARGTGRKSKIIYYENWPSGIHYEFIDEGAGGIGLDIHLEADDVKSLAEVLVGFKESFTGQFPKAQVLWDQKWSKNRGRLRVVFERGADPDALAEAMKTIIKETYPAIDKTLKGN